MPGPASEAGSYAPPPPPPPPYSTIPHPQYAQPGYPTEKVDYNRPDANANVEHSGKGHYPSPQLRRPSATTFQRDMSQGARQSYDSRNQPSYHVPPAHHSADGQNGAYPYNQPSYPAPQAAPYQQNQYIPQPQPQYGPPDAAGYRRSNSIANPYSYPNPAGYPPAAPPQGQGYGLNSQYYQIAQQPPQAQAQPQYLSPNVHAYAPSRPADPNRPPRQHHQHHHHHRRRSHDRDRAHSSPPTTDRRNRRGSKSHEARDTFYGAGAGAILGDVLIGPGVGTAAVALLGGLGGNQHAKQKERTRREQEVWEREQHRRNDHDRR